MKTLIIAGLAAALTVAGCAPPPPKTTGQAPSGGVSPSAGAELEPIWIHVTLAYTRPRLVESAGRPTEFGFIRDYRAADATVETFTGAWNDGSQTLTADVTVTLKSENLVYVDDPALTPGAETPIRAGRGGQLHEVTCPETVPPEHACYLLQILR